MGTIEKLNQKNIVDRIVVAYVFCWLICFVLNLIIPFRSILALPILNLWYSVLGVGGVILVIYDIATQKLLFKTKYMVLLVVLLGIMCISSLLNVTYGIAANIKAMMWFVIQVALLYSLYLRFPEKTLIRFLSIAFHIFFALWVMADLVAFFQYLFSISYDVVIDGIHYHQGVYQNRVFGIFRSVGYGPLYSLFLIFGAIYFWRQSKSKLRRSLYLIGCIILFVYIILSGSRTILLGSFLSVFFYVFLYCRSSFHRKMASRGKGVAFALGIALVACFGFLVICNTATTVLGKCPGMVASLMESDYVAKGDADGKQKNPSKEVSHRTGKESALERDDISENNISNNRFTIWENYWDIGKQHLLFGLSLRNDVPRISEEYSDYYIVQYFKEHYPDSYAKGEIYGVHNNYISVFVQNGILGSLAFLLFLGFSIKDIILFYIRHPQKNDLFVFLSAVLGNILFFLLFECEVFFEAGSLSAIFWIVLGLMQKIILSEASASKERCGN